MDHAELKDLLPLAALERLDPVEEAALGAHLREGCAQCEAELQTLKEAAAALALSLEPAQVEGRIWRRLKARLGEELPAVSTAGQTGAPEVSALRAQGVARPAASGAATLRRPPRVWPWRAATGMASAAAVVLAIMGGAATREFRRVAQAQRMRIAHLARQVEDLSEALSSAREKAAHLEHALNRHARLQGVLMAADAHVMHLEPLNPAPNARAMVAMSASGRSAMIQAAGLPPTPAGKAYEMWWITKQRGPVPAGVFHAEAGREVLASIDPPPAGERLLMAAVTLEPAHGMPKPTGAMYLKAWAAAR